MQGDERRRQRSRWTFSAACLHLLIRIPQLLELIQREPVGHARDIVADDPFLAVVLHLQAGLGRQELGLSHVDRKQAPQDPPGLVGHPYHPVVAVEVILEEFFQFLVLYLHRVAEVRYVALPRPHGLKRAYALFLDGLSYGVHQVSDLRVYYPYDGLGFEYPEGLVGELLFYLIELLLPEGGVASHLGFEHL